MSFEAKIDKLHGATNYYTWRYAMLNILEMNGLEGAISENDDGEVTETEAAKLKKAKNLLVLNIDTSLYTHISKYENADSIWTALRRMYDDRGLTRRIGLLRGLISVRLESSGSMQAYVDEITTLANKVRSVGFDLSDNWLTAIILAGLTDDYKPLIMGLEASGNEIKSDDVVSKLIDNAGSDEANQAFAANGKKNSKKQWKRKCYSCGSTDHLKKDCDKNKSKDKKTAFYAATAYAATHDSTDWIIDSGASGHMTCNRDLLKGIKTGGGKIMTAGGGLVDVQGVGQASVYCNGKDITVDKVMYVPDFKVNLLSISGIVAKGNVVTFNKNGCVIKNQNNELIASVKPDRGVYRLTQTVGDCFTNMLTSSDAMMWHRKLGHVNGATLLKMKNVVDGLKLISTDLTDVNNCKVCAEGKQTKLPFPRSKSETTEILKLLHTDVIGPMETLSIGKSKYIVTIVDDYSRYTWALMVKEKSEVTNAIISHINMVEKQTGKCVKIIRSDNGLEFVNNNMENYCKKKGIRHQKSSPYTPQQNGVAERFNRSIIEKAKCLLFDADLPKCYWAEAVNMATYIMNRILSSTTGNVPHEVFYGCRVDISQLKLFGTKVMMYIPKEKRTKLDKNSKEMIFVGYDDNTKGYRLSDKLTRSIVISRNVKFLDPPDQVRVSFHESEPASPNITGPADSTTDVDARVVVGKESQADEENISDDESGNNDVGESENDDVGEVTEQLLQNVTADDTNDETFVPSSSNSNLTSSSTPVTRRTRDTPAPRPFWANLAILTDECYTSKYDRDNLNDPVTCADLSGRPDAKLWYQAMKDEINSLMENDTWDLVTLPKGQKTVKNKWVFKTKCDSDGRVVRFKARLVAKGYTQRHGVDYDETYAPVVRYTSVRLLMAVAARKGLRVHQMDAVTAFLQGDVDEDIYVAQPEGFDDGTGRVCKLKRAIYGLKQAGRQWNKKLDTTLKNIGLKCCCMDPCIYYTSDLELIIAIYVDDFLIFYKDNAKLKNIIETLSNSFKMKDMGPARGCIGIRIRQTENGIELDQQVYIEEVLKRFGMLEAKPVGNPCDTNTKLSKKMDAEKAHEYVELPYQQAVGCLLFIAQATRPDISFAVNDVSRFNNCYEPAHWNAVKRIMRYLKLTSDMKLTYNQNGGNLVGYTDADWAADVDSRKSVTGYVFVMAGGAVSWKSSKQQTVALSSTEAEYIALASTTQEALWLLQLCTELGIVKKGATCTLYCDNQSAIKLAELSGFRPRSRHIDIKYHFIRQHIEKKNIQVNFVNTEANIADVLTKAVAKEKLIFCAIKMGLIKQETECKQIKTKKEGVVKLHVTH